MSKRLPAFVTLKIFRKYLFNNANYLKRANNRMHKWNQVWNVLFIVRELFIVFTRRKKSNKDLLGMHQYKIIVKTKEYMKIASRQLMFVMSAFRVFYISTCVNCFLPWEKTIFNSVRLACILYLSIQNPQWHLCFEINLNVSAWI